MRMRTALAGVLWALASAAAPARSAPEPGTVSVSGRLGWSTVSLGDVNDLIRATRDDFQADTAVSDVLWSEFGGEPNLGVEVDVQLTERYSVGLTFSRQRGSRRHEALRSFADPVTPDFADESFEEEPRYTAWDVAGTFALWVPSAEGLYVGAQLGFIRGKIENQTVFRSETNTDSVLELGQGAWDGTGVVLGAFTGYEQPLSPALAVSSRIGYRYRNIKRPDGVFTLTGFSDSGHYREFESGPLTNGDGEPIELDLSGFYVTVGMSVKLGGKE